MPAQSKWKKQDPLFSGDAEAAVSVPTPDANAAIVRHILYLEGPGRESPYLSVSEARDLAARFAQDRGLWKTFVKHAAVRDIGHISNKELLQLLKGAGKGMASWDDGYEVMQARRYVEQWSEHLLDFRRVADPALAVIDIFEKV